MRDFIIAGNWKMNAPDIQDFAHSLTELGIKADDHVEIVVAVPFPFVSETARRLSPLGACAGAQDISAHESGAFTGEVSGAMLAKCGARFVIVAHSERREYHSESDELALAKVKAALSNDLYPILCVGESLIQRESGAAKSVVQRQTEAVFTQLSHDQRAHVTVAYEPLWAIGTGNTATPEDAEEMCAFITDLTSRPTLYGGSMNEKNARSLLSQPHIAGGLIGGASLDAGKFAEIIKHAKELSE